MRIVSLLPSATEILFAIGAGGDVVAVTSDCDWPPGARSLPKVSVAVLEPGASPAAIDAAVRERLAAGDDLYRLDAERVRELAPDLVVTQDLCAVCAVDTGAVVDALGPFGGAERVVTLDPATLDDVLATIGALGAATGREEAAATVVCDLRARLDAVARAVSGRPAIRVLVLEWTDPPFGAGHWVPDLVVAARGTPVDGAPGDRSRELRDDELASTDAELVVVAPCGYHLEDAESLAREVCASGRLPGGLPVVAVDADATFVRPGPRLVDGVEGLAGVLHPGCLAPRDDVARYVGVTSTTANPSRTVASPTETPTR